MKVCTTQPDFHHSSNCDLSLPLLPYLLSCLETRPLSESVPSFDIQSKYFYIISPGHSNISILRNVRTLMYSQLPMHCWNHGLTLGRLQCLLSVTELKRNLGWEEHWDRVTGPSLRANMAIGCLCHLAQVIYNPVLEGMGIQLSKTHQKPGIADCFDHLFNIITLCFGTQFIFLTKISESKV